VGNILLNERERSGCRAGNIARSRDSDTWRGFCHEFGYNWKCQYRDDDANHSPDRYRHGYRDDICGKWCELDGRSLFKLERHSADMESKHDRHGCECNGIKQFKPNNSFGSVSAIFAVDQYTVHPSPDYADDNRHFRRSDLRK
jgi:hypothetical protein